MENNCKREFYIFEMFSGKVKPFIKAYTHRARLSHYFVFFKTIFQVQVRKTLEHNRICPDIVQVL